MNTNDLIVRLKACAECEQAPLGTLLAEAAAELTSLRTAQPEGGETTTRDRARDRRNFADADFNRWLDEGISGAGHTVWGAVGDVSTAWSAWCAREFYTTPPAAQVQQKDGITAEWVIGYFPSDVAEEVKRAVHDAFGEHAALATRLHGGECSQQCMDTMSCDNSCKPAVRVTVEMVERGAEGHWNAASHKMLEKEDSRLIGHRNLKA